MIRILLIPSSDYLGHPFPQRHNHIFERVHDGREFEVHVVRFNLFGKPRLTSRCIIHEIQLELKTRSTALYYLVNAPGYSSEIMKIVKQESIDVVVSGNILPPLIVDVISRFAQRKILTIFDLQDYYPASALGYLGFAKYFKTPLRGLLEAITQELIRSSSVVTTPGIALAHYARKVGARNVYLVPNGISEHFLVQHDGRDIRSSLGFKDEDVVVGYIGSVEFWLDMKPLIQAISTARQRGIPVKLLVVGKHIQTGYYKKVRKWVSNYGIEDITMWTDFVPYQYVPKYIAALDIGTIPFNVQESTAYYAAPNKLWEYLSQGIFVVATPIPEVLLHRDLAYIIKKSDDYLRVIEMSRRSLQKSSRSLIMERAKERIRQRLWSNIAVEMKNIVKSVSRRVNVRLVS